MTKLILTATFTFLLSFAMNFSSQCQTVDTSGKPAIIPKETGTNIAIHLANDSLQSALIKALDKYNQESAIKQDKPNRFTAIMDICKKGLDILSLVLALIGFSGGALGIIGWVKENRKKKNEPIPVAPQKDDNWWDKLLAKCRALLPRFALLLAPVLAYIFIRLIFSLITPLLIAFPIGIIAVILFFYVLLLYLKYFESKEELSRIYLDYKAPYSANPALYEEFRISLEKELGLIRVTNPVYVTFFPSILSGNGKGLEQLISIVSQDSEDENTVVQRIRHKFPTITIETSRG